jgi:nucleotide-binding universal stress UspA family protein
MIKRILVAFGGIRANPGTNFWAAQVAKRLQASVTIVPLLDVDSWMRLMPAMMTSGHAARILESRPWDVAPEGLRQLQQQCESVYTPAGVPWELANAGSSPWECLLSETRFHDLLVFGLDDAYDPLIVPNFLQAAGVLLGDGACPLLCVPATLREVKSVLIAFSGTVASARALKRFVHSHLWNDAPVEIVCQSDDHAEAQFHLQHAERYLFAHGSTPRTTVIGGNATDLCRYAVESSADLIVAGSSHRNRLGIETSSEVLRGFLAQTTLPVFIASS